MPSALAAPSAAASPRGPGPTLTRRAVELLGGDGLHGVDDQQARPLVAGELRDPARRPSRRRRGWRPPTAPVGQPEARCARSRTWPSIPRPSRRAPPRPSARDARRHLEQERGLADARLAAEQDDGPRDQPAAEHPVELADARPAGATSAPPSPAWLAGRARPRPAPTAAAGARRIADDGLDEGVPLAAGAALALPAQHGRAAGLADVPALGAGHRAALRPAVRLRPASSPRSPLIDEALAVGIQVDHDRVALVVPAQQQVLCERILDQVLDRAAQRPGPVGLVVAELDDVLLGGLRDLEASCPGP